MADLGLYDAAARGAVSLLISRGYKSQEAAEKIHEVVGPILGGASKVSRWARFGASCHGAPNRKWVNYAAIKALVHKIADEAEVLL